MPNEMIEFFLALNSGPDIMSTFTKNAIENILYECWNQLTIIRHVNTFNFGEFDNDTVQYQTIEERITKSENYEDMKIPAIGINQDKLATDITNLINVCKKTSHEIAQSGTYKILKDSIKHLRRMKRDVDELYKQKDDNVKLIKTLKSQIEEERNASLKLIEEIDDDIQQIRFEVEDITVYGKTERKFLFHYEETRRRQNLLKCKIAENRSLDVIEKNKEKIELEQKCHKLFLDYIMEDQEDLLKATDYWMNTYETEVERKENELMKMKGELDCTQDELDKATQMYDRRQAEIDRWEDYKRIKREKEERIKLEIWAITRIQAWWRGTMVRKDIPPGGKPETTKSIKSRKSKASAKGKKGKKGKKKG
ncbi:unnamed protein product [Phyllotreta striolata]|uniref:Dynein regulatory complex protein 9 n=1 Tax=Phyllotreta striolata TaxID=444603 RepID=A0A9N9TGM5_PHYSR|nr:unnamed protein product [Phyllotreta striolata]